MADIEKVIKAAEICLRYIDDGDCPTECPYFDLCTQYEKRVVFQPLIRDALILLKKQKTIRQCKDCKFYAGIHQEEFAMCSELDICVDYDFYCKYWRTEV